MPGFPLPLTQNLINSQQVASDLSSKCEQQAIELDQLRKAKEDLIGELQAQKFVVSGWGGGGGGGGHRKGR